MEYLGKLLLQPKLLLNAIQSLPLPLKSLELKECLNCLWYKIKERYYGPAGRLGFEPPTYY